MSKWTEEDKLRVVTLTAEGLTVKDIAEELGMPEGTVKYYRRVKGISKRDSEIGIYKITFADDSIYIGKSTNLGTRLASHIKGMYSGKHHNFKVQAKFDEFGIPKFDVLEKLEVEDDLDLAETKYIREAILNKLEILNIQKVFDPKAQQVDTITQSEEVLQLRAQVDTITQSEKVLQARVAQLEGQLAQLEDELAEISSWVARKKKSEAKERGYSENTSTFQFKRAGPM